jgi:hypothetical protein
VTGADTRVWRSLPSSTAQFTTELLPAPGQTSCSTTSPQLSMLENGTFRVRATGRANGDKRSIVATFKRKSFVDFLYFTTRETLPPAAYQGTGITPATAQANCDAPRSSRPNWCMRIQFAAADRIDGPFHTEDDSILVCNSPTFGRTSADRIEIVGPAPGHIQSGGCGGTPNYLGTRYTPASSLSLPPTNAGLATLADPNYKFTGNTCLEFTGASVRVWANQAWSGSVPCPGAGSPTATRSLPAPNGVIYVDNGAGCTGGYQYYQNYSDPSSCGNVAVVGNYSSSTTVGARNDIVIRGDLRNTGSAMMGLVANNFVRVYHQVTNRSGDDCDNAASLSNVTIDAAILAVNQSFIADNWYCGSALGNLTVNGAIGQYWRGAVGQSGGGNSGYIKDYNYDDRLKYAEPPNFLDPVQASWRLIRRTEQQPAT